MLSLKTKIAVLLTIFLWASAFVGIRAGLQDYSPEGLALLRYMIVSVCMGIVYFRLPQRRCLSLRDASILLGIGAMGIGIYNLMLNYGELSVSSGTASFIICQAPVMTAIFAILFLEERLTWRCIIGFMISMIGVGVITFGELGEFKWDKSVSYILIAMLVGSAYSVMQKPFLKKYHAIEVTTYIIWGGTLLLSLYYGRLETDLLHASFKATAMVIYLGIFPAALGYIAWSYIISQIPVSRAASFLYFTPFIATLLGWLYLGETLMWISIIGGLIATVGIWFVNQSYLQKPSRA